MVEITFDSLPIAVVELTKEVRELKHLITTWGKEERKEDEILSVDECAEFLNLSVPTIYSKVSRGELPVMKRSKRLYFSKSDLIQYLKAGRIKTNNEIDTQSSNYLRQTHSK